MLVDINLLPKKEYKNKAFLIMIGLIVGSLLIGMGIVYGLYHTTSIKEQKLTDELNELKAERITVEQNKANGVEVSDVIQLDKIVNWADSYFVETVPILTHVSELLPERGFLQSFSYNEGGSVSFIVQFDTNKEVAHYLARLNKSPYITSASLTSVSSGTMQVEQADETVDENTTEIDESEAERAQENVDVIPRYVAHFELTLDQVALKQLQREDADE